MKKIKIICFLILACHVVSAQSELDIYNLYDAQIYRMDSSISANHIKTVRTQKIFSNKKTSLLSVKAYNNGFLYTYQCNFLGSLHWVNAKIVGDSVVGIHLQYWIKKTNYDNDSDFVSRLLNRRIPYQLYQSSPTVQFSLHYSFINDSTIDVVSSFNDVKSDSIYSLFFQKNTYSLNSDKRFMIYLSEVDKKKGLDTSTINTFKVYKKIEASKMDKIVTEEYFTNSGDSLTFLEKTEKRYDEKNRIIWYANYSNINGKPMVLNKSEKITYQPNGIFTIYEDKFLADGRVDKIYIYNKHGNILNKKVFFVEGGFTEHIYKYNKQNLLINIDFYVDAKYKERLQVDYYF